ncbi:MAG TPA: 5,10-methylenetetrahydrofolate reductase [Armatimonadetes bacterium]|nr:5,10-methylenetetrahydrofolate reductase [Armatimonadota bacterium]
MRARATSTCEGVRALIATRSKEFEELLKTLADAGSVYIVGCGDCATVLQTGGEYEVNEMTGKLQEQGKTVTGTIVPDVTCQILDIKRLLRKQADAVDAADAVLVMACGCGIQAVAEVLEGKRVVAGLDTVFAADKGRAGEFYEYCSLCGDCVVDQYAGVCPVTRCPKGQLNGPCGGTDGGKCEVDSEKDCVWTLIYKRMETAGDADDVKHRLANAKKWEKGTKPHSYVFEPRRG